METIYSKIIWNKLNLKDYSIHTEPFEKTQELILEYLKGLNRTQFEEEIHNMSSISRVKDEGYYDGQFYELTNREPELDTDIEQKITNQEKILYTDSGITLHDTDVFPSLLSVMMKTGISSDELLFMSKIMKLYEDKREAEPHNRKSDDTSDF